MSGWKSIWREINAHNHTSQPQGAYWNKRFAEFDKALNEAVAAVNAYQFRGGFVDPVDGSLRPMPDGPEKERAANALPSGAAIEMDSWERRIVEKAAARASARQTPVLQPGDHVLLRLSPVEEQRCVVSRIDDDRRFLWVTLNGCERIVAFGQCTKVDPITVKEPTVTRGKVRIKPGCGL